MAAFLAKHYGGVVGSRLGDAIGTVTGVDHHSLVTAELQQGTDHAEQVRALLLAYYGTDQAARLTKPLPTATTHDRFGIVTVAGQDYVIADIGMRMLQPRELYRAQGFPETYQIERGADGRQLSKAAQVRMCGNSVCPPVAMAIVRDNFVQRTAFQKAA